MVMWSKMKISLKIGITLVAFSLLIASIGYISLDHLNKIAEPLTKDIPESITELVEASRLGGQAELLRNYDEVLSQSAENYVLTQDKIWEERYKQLEPELAKQIKTVLEDSNESNRKNLQEIYEANRAIATMEYGSIELVNDGKQEAAINLLQSEEYLNKKSSYQESLREYEAISGSEYIKALANSTDVLTLTMTDAQKLVKESTQLFTLYVVIYIVIAAGLGFFLFRSVAKPVKSLRNATEKIASGQWNVKIDSKGNDEIHDLARSFKSMIDVVKKSEELLSAAEKKYRELYESSPDLYCTTDRGGIILDCNKSYSKRLGYTKEEVIGTSLFNYAADIKAIKNSFDAWNQTGNVISDEIWLMTKDGTTFPTLFGANNLYDENGNLIGSNTIIKDISEIYDARKKIEMQTVMELQLAELKKLEKAKDEFISMMTHELKTPLTPIFGYCDMLKEPGLLGNLNPVQLNSINRISESARRLGRLIGEILEAQKLEMGSMKFDKQELDVTKLMSEIHNDYIQLMKEKQIRIINYTEEKLTLKSDGNRIRQVIDNMVLNSIDFMPEKDGEISIGAVRVDDQIVFHVKDNGMGIPQDELDKIFVKFYQVDTSHTRKHPGTGLGLSICKGIVEGLGGKIWVESEFGKGTNFYFSIPQEK